MVDAGDVQFLAQLSGQLTVCHLALRLQGGRGHGDLSETLDTSLDSFSCIFSFPKL